MSTDLPLITASHGVSVVSATDAARAHRDALLRDAGTVTTITDRLDADAALSVQRACKEFINTVEGQREAAKAPVLELGRRIDGLAKELLSDVKTQEQRIALLSGAFEAEERQKAEIARRNAEIEAARIAFEAAKKERAALASAQTAADAARASDEIAGKAQTEIAAVRAVAVAAVAPKATGTQVRTDPKWEVTDIKALHAAHPELCVVSTNDAAIRAILKANPNLQVPGLRHWQESKLNVR